MSDIDKIKGFKPDGGGGLFLKLSDGETVKVRLASLPVIFTNTFTRADGEVNVDTRFAFRIWNHDANKAQIWATNAATYGQQISGLLEDEEYGDWRDYDIKISRAGEKQSTRYHLRPGTKRYKLEKDQVDACEKVDIINLIDKSDSASHVMWLSDYRDQQEQGVKTKPEEPKKQTPKAVPANNGSEDEVEIEDIGDEPINLEDIPF